MVTIKTLTERTLKMNELFVSFEAGEMDATQQYRFMTAVERLKSDALKSNPKTKKQSMTVKMVLDACRFILAAQAFHQATGLTSHDMIMRYNA